MNGFLVDTNVLSERRDPKVLAWRQANESRLYTSAVCIGELAHGIARLAAGKKKTDLCVAAHHGEVDHRVPQIGRAHV